MSPGLFVPDKIQEHVPAAPGEQQYASVPIPEAYASPLASPSFAPGYPQPQSQSQQEQLQQHYSGFDFGDAVRRNA